MRQEKVKKHEVEEIKIKTKKFALKYPVEFILILENDIQEWNDNKYLQ